MNDIKQSITDTLTRYLSHDDEVWEWCESNLSLDEADRDDVQGQEWRDYAVASMQELRGYDDMSDEYKNTCEAWLEHKLKSKPYACIVDGDFSDIDEDVRQSIQEGLLSIDPVHYLDIVVAINGPTAYYHIEFDSDGDWIRGEFIHTGCDRSTLGLNSGEIKEVLSMYGLDDPYLVRQQLGLEV